MLALPQLQTMINEKTNDCYATPSQSNVEGNESRQASRISRMVCYRAAFVGSLGIHKDRVRPLPEAVRDPQTRNVL